MAGTPSSRLTDRPTHAMFRQGWPLHHNTRALHANQGASPTLHMLQQSSSVADRDAGSSSLPGHEAAYSTMVLLTSLESAHEAIHDLTGCTESSKLANDGERYGLHSLAKLPA